MNSNSWKYRTTNQYFDHLDFHDCVVEKLFVENETVFIDFEFVYISKSHPLNPYGVPKATDKSRLTFNGVTMVKAIIYFDDGEEREKEIPIVDLEEMESLKFDQSPIGSDFIFEIFGTDWKTNQFCSIKLKATNFTLEWNDFTDDAWYA
jgi:hypothetical protein